MEQNTCGYDRIARIILASALLGLGYRYRDHTVGTLAFIGGSDLLATAVIRRCPLNAILGVNTCR